MIYQAGYVPWGTKAFLDGVEVKNVFRADPAEGWVEFYPHPFVVEPNNTVRIDVLRGCVIVVTPDGQEFIE